MTVTDRLSSRWSHYKADACAMCLLFCMHVTIHRSGGSTLINQSSGISVSGYLICTSTCAFCNQFCIRACHVLTVRPVNLFHSMLLRLMTLGNCMHLRFSSIYLWLYLQLSIQSMGTALSFSAQVLIIVLWDDGCPVSFSSSEIR